jgi:hypothetical protein
MLTRTKHARTHAVLCAKRKRKRMHTQVRTHTCSRALTRMNACMRMHARGCMHARAHTHAHACMHARTQRGCRRTHREVGVEPLHSGVDGLLRNLVLVTHLHSAALRRKLQRATRNMRDPPCSIVDARCNVRHVPRNTHDARCITHSDRRRRAAQRCGSDRCLTAIE